MVSTKLILLIMCVVVECDQDLHKSDGCKDTFKALFSDPEWDVCKENRHNITSETPTDIYLENSSIFNGKSCFCDKECHIYEDCCRNVENSFSRRYDGRNERYKCLELPLDLRKASKIYMVAKCADQWANDSTRARCEADGKLEFLQSVPVYSKRSNTTYVNIYCAACNSDIDIVKWAINLKCEGGEASLVKLRAKDGLKNFNYDHEYREWRGDLDGVLTTCSWKFKLDNRFGFREYLKSYPSRSCKSVTKSCLREWEGSYEESECPRFASYRYITSDFGSSTVYNNGYCAKCNNEDLDELRCFELPMLQEAAFYPIFDSGTFKKTTSFNIVFDFNLAADQSFGVGAREERCLFGEIYDPIMRECVRVACGRLFELQDGVCKWKETKQIEDGTSNFSINPNSRFLLNSTCAVRSFSQDEYQILPNETVLVITEQKSYARGEYEFNRTTNSTILIVCLSDENEEIIYRNDDVQGILTIVCLAASTLCLLAHVIIYGLVPKLRNLPGKNLMCLSISLLLAQLLFLFGIRRVEPYELCLSVSLSLQYFFLAYFAWMNVMAVDIYRTFGAKTGRSEERKTFVKYSVYAWLVPFVSIVPAAIFDFTEIVHHQYRPGYARGLCWITNKRALAIFFALPAAILLFANITLFVMTAINLHKVSKITKKVVKRPDKLRYILYVKLAVLMGLTWTIAFVASFEKYHVLEYSHIVLNGLQGCFIFAAFTCKRKVYLLIKRRFTSLKDSRQSRSESTNSSTLVASLSSGRSFRKSSTSKSSSWKKRMSVSMDPEKCDTRPKTSIVEGAFKTKHQTVL